MVHIRIIEGQKKKQAKVRLKKGMRALGIAECFVKGKSKKSLIVGVLMRADFQIDGFGFSFATVGGLDATDSIISLIKRMNRPDINVVLISGVVISLYNVIDLHKLYKETNRPLIAISYEPSPGIDKYVLQMPEGQKRLEILRRNGPRIKVVLKNGLDIYIRPVGINVNDAISVLNFFTLDGRYPEPIRVAKLLARALYYFLTACNLLK